MRWSKLMKVSLVAVAYKIEEDESERTVGTLDNWGDQIALARFMDKFKHSVRIDLLVTNTYKNGDQETRVAKRYWVDYSMWE